MGNKYKLVIVESPAKAKTIEKYLGEGYKVIASKGHIMDLPKKGFGIDLNSFDWEIVPIEGKEDTIDQIRKIAQDASEVFLASDADREGEAIAFHIRDIIKRKDAHRVLFNAITKSEITKAISNPQKLDLKKYEAQKTRRILDRIVGYKISPVLWKKMQAGLSAGRVQSVALRLIVERENEIVNFKPEKSFGITIYLSKNGKNFEAKFFGDNIKKRLFLEDETLSKSIFEKIKGKEAQVVEVLKQEKKQNPTAPFTTSKLQQEAAYKLGFDSKKTMQIAQKLYEGINLASYGQQGLITYMRTDSVRTDPSAIEAVRKHIEGKYGLNYVPSQAVVHIKKKTDVKAQDAHEAIRPTNLDLEPDKIKGDLDKDEFLLYSLIWNKFVASQMKPAELDSTTVFLDVNGYIFKSTGSVLKFDGFKKVYEEAKKEKQIKKQDESEEEDVADNSGELPLLEKDEKINQIKDPVLAEKWTTPPARFNDGTLVEELEKKGIGRPATYAAIISNIFARKYIDKNKENRYFPTDLGKNLCNLLIDGFPKQMDVTFTASMENNLDEVENGTIQWDSVLKTFWLDLKAQIEAVNLKLPDIAVDEKTIPAQLKTGLKCLECESGEYIIRKGSKGDFLACSKYPVCKSTKNFKKTKNNKIEFVEAKKTYHSSETCSLCSSKMAIIKGKNGKFLSCDNYPNCKGVKPMPLDFKCNTCSDGLLVSKKSSKGTIFYGCSKYPTCKNVVWNKPVTQKCKKCEYDWVEEVVYKDKETKKKKTFVVCPKCKNKDARENKES